LTAVNPEKGNYTPALLLLHSLKPKHNHRNHLLNQQPLITANQSTNELTAYMIKSIQLHRNEKRKMLKNKNLNLNKNNSPTNRKRKTGLKER
jgi:hypothetical protein